MDEVKYKYEWTLKDAVFTKDKGKVFSCFSCGGGSTMGYKLAGFDVIGCNEIDKKMMEIYIKNHNPKYSFLEPIQEFKNRDDLPEELFNLDILDGSPPCSSFSVASVDRAESWGKEKKFQEGQVEQILDTLFFDFIELGKRLQPKVIIAENVKGLLMGDARKYVNKILIAFDDAGYFVDYTLLDSSDMGLPQRRNRVFFTAIRKDLYKGYFTDLFGTMPVLDLEFNESIIPFRDIKSDGFDRPLPAGVLKYFKQRVRGENHIGDTKERLGEKCGMFGTKYQDDNKPLHTITANGSSDASTEPGRWLNDDEILKGQSYPMDYNFLKSPLKYVCGMSVPPVMVANIADRVYNQWLKN
jgi:DNA (cytosine-5)-methyltransferase 1